jgi:hypothetical protein
VVANGAVNMEAIGKPNNVIRFATTDSQGELRFFSSRFLAVAVKQRSYAFDLGIDVKILEYDEWMRLDSRAKGVNFFHRNRAILHRERE